jgi:ABC-2 type transport system ATP-binding protein
MSGNAVEIRGLEKTFPGFKLGPFDMTVPEGAIYGFVGPNGAGKTTTFDLMFGMGAKNAGTITVLGCDHVRGEVALKQQVGYVSPELNFAAWRSVSNAIQFMRAFRPSWDDDYCDRLLASLDLARAGRIAALSFGAKIKLALVLALAWRPKVLVLDEPTVGLDAISKQQVFAELLAAVREGDRTVLISSHGLSDLERFADHIGMIKHGRMLFEGATSDVVERYRLVDFTAPDPFRPPPDGWWPQANQAGRNRALVDLRQVPLSWLTARGATLIAETPVTLEDLFIAVGRD